MNRKVPVEYWYILTLLNCLGVIAAIFMHQGYGVLVGAGLTSCLFTLIDYWEKGEGK